MDQAEFKERTRVFALAVMAFVERLPRGRSAGTVARQVVRSATSVGANYRSACRAKSRADFIAKMTIVEEEADETIYWLELARDARLAAREEIEPLMKEADQITAMVVSSIRTAKRNKNNPRSAI